MAKKVIQEPQELEVLQDCIQPRLVTGTMWCDDFTDVYVGHCDTLSEKPVASIVTFDHNKVVKFETRANCCDYLYFVCWSNNSGENGFLADIAIGTNHIYSDNPHWEVFATGLDFDATNPRPTRASVLAQIEKADCHHYWVKPFQGPLNTGTPTPFNVKPMSPLAHFVWFDSGNDGPPFVGGPPFRGFNHKEYLIFRVAVKVLDSTCKECVCEDCECCDCGCSGCNENANAQEKVLAKRAQDKFNDIPGSANVSALCAPPYSGKGCTSALSVKSLNLCFHLSWGDSTLDQIEDTDYETLLLTVCNPYADLCFEGLRITSITITPSQPLNIIQIVPDSFICFDCLEPCTCKSREISINLKNAPSGPYSIHVEYCVDKVCVNMNASGSTSFPITVIPD